MRDNKNKESKLKLLSSKSWRCIFIISTFIITLFCGVKIYKSATDNTSKLAWYIKNIQNEKRISFTKNNIYEYGVKGIFEDINKKYKLPEKLYMSDDLSVKFEKDGTIIYFETFIYGKDKNGKEKTYLIYYDKNKSKDINLILNGVVNSDYSNDKLLDPLFETVELISIKDTVINYNENEFGLLYKGKVNWESYRDGIVLINKNGEEIPLNLFNGRLIGYPVSIYIPTNEDITPVRYNLLTDSYWFEYLNNDEENLSNEIQQEWNVVEGNSSVKDEFYLYDGWESLLSYDFSDLLILLLLVLAVAPAFTCEKENGMILILFSCKRGRWPMLFSKCGSAVIFSWLITALFALFNLLIFGLLCGFEGWNSPLYAIESYRNTPFSGSVLMFYVLICGAKAIGFSVTVLLLIFLSACFKKSMYPCLAGMGLCIILNY